MTLLTVSKLVNGVFYLNSKTRFSDIQDGASNTVLLGERSGDTFDSSWIGVVTGSDYTGWRVVGWTGEPPNNPAQGSSKHFHGYAQFNSMHPGNTLFSLCDGSTHNISDQVDPDVFFALGTTDGNETNHNF